MPEIKLKAVKKNKTLVEKVVDQIQTLIFAGNLKPGDKLPVEYKLAKTFNIAQSTMREALKILEGKGIVEIIPRKGIVVRQPKDSKEDFPITLDVSLLNYLDFLEFFRFQIAISAVQACAKRTDSQLEDFENILSEIEIIVNLIAARKADRKTSEKYGQLYIKFYSLLGESTGNSVSEMLIKKVLTTLSEQGPLADTILSSDLDLVHGALKGSKKLIGIIRQRDSINAFNAALKSIESFENIFSSPLKKRAADDQTKVQRDP